MSLETYNEVSACHLQGAWDDHSILSQAMKTGDVTSGRTLKLFMLGINCGFSNIVLDDFGALIEVSMHTRCLMKDNSKLGIHLMRPNCFAFSPQDPL